MKDSNLSQGACVREDEGTTTLPKKMRTTLSGCGCRCTHRAVPRKHRCCQWSARCALSPTQRFSIFLKFHFVPKFSSWCYAVAIHHNFYL